MRLLVSVTCAAEASAALAGGADVIDAKDPLAGALGAVSVEVLHEIYAAVARQRPLTAALGDAGDEAAIERAARTFVAAGAALVKVGFAGIASAGRVATLTTAADRGARWGAGSAARYRGQGRARTAWAHRAWRDCRVGGRSARRGVVRRARRQ